MYFDGERFVPLTEEYQMSVSELAISGDTLYAATDLGSVSYTHLDVYKRQDYPHREGVVPTLFE